MKCDYRRDLIIISCGSRSVPWLGEGPSMVGRRPQHATYKLAYLVLSSTASCPSGICPGHLSTAWLVSLVYSYRDVDHSSFHFDLCDSKFVLYLFGECPCLCTIHNSW